MKGQKMIMFTTITFTVAVIFAVLFYQCGKEDVEKGRKASISLMCFFLGLLLVVLLILSALENLIITLPRIKNEIALVMRHRLNEPIVSKEQLYGYKVISKKSSEEELLEDSSSSQVCLISIADLLEDKSIILHNVEVSKEFFPKLKAGDFFLPNIDPSIPTTTEDP